MEIKWKEEYSVGIQEIDEQHKYFLSILNDLYNAVLANKSREELKDLFQKLSDYAEKHFSTEEKYFDEFGYEGSSEHKLKHQEMREEIQRIKNEENENKIDLDGNIVYFLNDWLEDHFEKMDQKYKECFIEHGVK